MSHHKQLERKYESEPKTESPGGFFFLYIFGFVLGLVVMFLAIMGNFLPNPDEFEFSRFKNKEFNINSTSLAEGCYNLSLKKTAYCLKNNVDSFYFYNLSQRGEWTNLTKLMNNGGTCLHYSLAYEEAINQLGYYVNRPIFRTSNSSRHTFIILSWDHEFCVLDQNRIIGCMKLGN